MSTHFNENLKKLLLNEVHELPASTDLHEFQLDKPVISILLEALKLEIITKNEVLVVLHDVVLKFGRMAYELTLKGTFADHVFSTECLAYALHHRTFSTKEESKIKFDHSDTVATYIDQHYRKDELEILYKKLFGL